MNNTCVNLLPYQKAAVENPARFTWNCWARQTGKSFTFSLRRVLRGLTRRRDQIILSAGERQSREVMQKVRMHCQALSAAMTLRGCDDFAGMKWRHLEAILPGGVRILALPANPMTTRGFTGDVLLDEFAMHEDDRAIWAALFPTLLRGAGELDVASTPRGRRNMFHRLHSNDMFARTTITLADAIAAGLKVDAGEMRAAIGDELAWRQEFCCEFIDEATAFMPLDLIARCQDARLTSGVDWPRLGRREARIYVGVDVGRYRDITAIWLWERSARPLIAGDAAPTEGYSRRVDDDIVFTTRGLIVLAAAPFAEQEGVLAGLLDSPAVRRCCLDASGLGIQLGERLASRYGEHRVEGVTFTAALKSELAAALRVRAERGQLLIPVDEAIVADWHSITRLASRGGHVRYDADRASGGHGDRFWAAALGLHAARDDAGDGRPGLLTSGPAAFGRAGVW
jgi:phage FluMu gp28-like protein